MNLVIDIGNSSAKFYLLEKGKCIWHSLSAANDNSILAEALAQKPEKAIIASVASAEGALKEGIANMSIPNIMLNSDTKLPIKNNYSTPSTLGADRLATAVGAATKYPGKELLVIDFGTCITMDYVDSHGIYHGGNISPGLKMRLRAMHQGTSRLPLVDYSTKWPEKLGKSTQEAILAGTKWGIIYEIEGMIKNLQIPDLIVIFTGGYYETFAEHIEITDIHIEPLLIAEGLNEILEFNSKQ